MSNKNDPNKQFLAFDALKFIKQTSQNSQKCLKKEICEDDAKEISDTLSILKKLDIVEVTYYNKDYYHTITGAVSEINFCLKYLKVIKQTINFDDILSVNKIKEA